MKRRIKPIFEGVDYENSIRKMTRAILARSVSMDVSPCRIAEYLWPAEPLQVLRGSFMFTYQTPYYVNEIGPKPWECMYIHYNPYLLGITRPKPGLVILNTADEELHTLVLKAIDIIQKGARLNKLIHTISNNYKLSEVRYVFPQLASLLPAEHAFHTVKPQWKGNMMVPEGIRECVEFLTMGLLADPNADYPVRTMLGLQTDLCQWRSEPDYTVF